MQQQSRWLVLGLGISLVGLALVLALAMRFQPTKATEPEPTVLPKQTWVNLGGYMESRCPLSAKMVANFEGSDLLAWTPETQRALDEYLELSAEEISEAEMEMIKDVVESLKRVTKDGDVKLAIHLCHFDLSEDEPIDTMVLSVGGVGRPESVFCRALEELKLTEEDLKAGESPPLAYWVKDGTLHLVLTDGDQELKDLETILVKEEVVAKDTLQVFFEGDFLWRQVVESLRGVGCQIDLD